MLRKSGNGFLSELCQVSGQDNKIGVVYLTPLGIVEYLQHIGKELSTDLDGFFKVLGGRSLILILFDLVGKLSREQACQILFPASYLA